MHMLTPGGGRNKGRRSHGCGFPVVGRDLRANLGGNLSPIGSASTLVAVTIIHKHNLKLSFRGFVRKALPFAVVQLVIAVAYVLLVLPAFG